ncbi:uncharacterized protein [Triticum aestivum]|uniref:uncharacterized protein n=1 Tax=Triticum aestivum TaxID=4565 RepID=UPI001D00AC3C|nr:uncharacterized protein LOC123066142 [Triticum aestivum]XP_044446118.1 uncharacterized protein LOC123175221 isoform X2 [Triticum aestivum]
MSMSFRHVWAGDFSPPEFAAHFHGRREEVGREWRPWEEDDAISHQQDGTPIGSLEQSSAAAMSAAAHIREEQAGVKWRMAKLVHGIGAVDRHGESASPGVDIKLISGMPWRYILVLLMLLIWCGTRCLLAPMLLSDDDKVVSNWFLRVALMSVLRNYNRNSLSDGEAANEGKLSY